MKYMRRRSQCEALPRVDGSVIRVQSKAEHLRLIPNCPDIFFTIIGFDERVTHLHIQTSSSRSPHPLFHTTLHYLTLPCTTLHYLTLLVNSSSDMVQYHALSLLYKIKQHDRLAVSKIVQQLSKGETAAPTLPLHSLPFNTCHLVRELRSYRSNFI